MTKLSDGTEVASIANNDEVVMLRPSGAVYTNIRATVNNFLTEILALLGTDTVSWASLDKTGSDLADLVTKSHTALTDIGTKTHAEIDSFIAAHSPAKIVTFAPVESSFSLRIVDGTIAFTIPALLNGYNLTAALISVHTLGAGTGTTTVQVRRRRAGADVDMLSTRITLAVAEYFIADGVIDTSNDDLQTGDQIYVDIDQLPTTPPKGLSVALTVSPGA